MRKLWRYALVGFAAIASLITVLTATAQANAPTSASSPFELVLIDLTDEKQLGGFPVDRALIAKAVTILKDAGARGVVLKFFYDQTGKSPASDQALVEAIGSIKTLLQARIDEAEVVANPLPARFFPGVVSGNFKVSLTGTSGWIPLAPFAAAAYDIGFVDISSPDNLPMIESYQGKPVKSLALAALELATGEQAKINSGKQIIFGKQSITLTADNQVALNLGSVALTDYVPFSALLEGKVGKAQFRDKVVVIAYDGSKMHFLTTKAGTIKAHRLFYLGLLETYRQLNSPK